MSNQLQQIQILPGFAAATALGLVAVVGQPGMAASLIPVDTELSLLIDVSRSVSLGDYDLQMEGYQTAFTNLASRFGSDDFGSVAVNLIQWAGADDQEESIPWTLLNDEASVLAFTDTIASVERRRDFGGTVPGSAIEFATPLFSINDYDGQRWVIDVSGDGAQNSIFGVESATARDNALVAGVDAINGLPIVTSSRSTVDDWYRDNIQGGEGSFTIAANGFEDVGRALEQKLIAELTLPPSEPEPPVVIPTPPAEPEPPVIVPIPPAESESPVSVPEPMALWGLITVFGGLLCRQGRNCMGG
ncbi:MAG: DUF1194 domain-containing protein [Cyanobacteria bacterium J06642_11]